jgi:hypothetical protein
LCQLLNSDEKAIDFLMANPDIVESVQSVVEGVARNNYNAISLDKAKELLNRFPAEVQLSYAKQLLEDRDRMRQALETTIEQQQVEIEELKDIKKEGTAQKKEIVYEIAAQKRKIDAQEREIAALREAMNDTTASDELAALASTASALDAFAEVKVKVEPGLETTTRASKRSKKR